MPSTSKCSKSKRQKTKEQWQVGMQPTRNWLELPSDVMASILSRVGLHDIIKNAEKVCTAWQKICKDPSMWRVICIDNPWQFLSYERFINLCKHAVDRSQGQLIDITIGHFEIFGDFELLQYVADRSSRLRRLKIRTYYSSWCRSWTDPLKKFQLLEEFSLHSYHIPKEVVETVGCYCPLLKTFKLSTGSILCNKDDVASCDKMAITIGENFHELEQLQLIGNKMTNIGLQAILDGCRNLKSLDLRMCPFIDLKGDLGKGCSQQIKCLKLSDDPWWFVYVASHLLQSSSPVIFSGEIPATALFSATHFFRRPQPFFSTIVFPVSRGPNTCTTSRSSSRSSRNHCLTATAALGGVPTTTSIPHGGAPMCSRPRERAPIEEKNPGKQPPLSSPVRAPMSSSPATTMAKTTTIVVTGGLAMTAAASATATAVADAIQKPGKKSPGKMVEVAGNSVVAGISPEKMTGWPEKSPERGDLLVTFDSRSRCMKW
ncbi:hypothetical protein OSB04_005606 [Centaurea solstitialis]|uniref:F-box domain-containing protein n=1 Tax=Centaurea solstitialis TaxID=347529 RepID=A0AA38TU95_9ASTR|nr:hypothetical protein OSB04_005606 [Centaurea solstitialis]